ncbi:acetate--CoA ligase [Catelliglobosispora koreensis]|uniref:acetate--CoA ligase n=1 Tax=Catelliglobosispora koreensis TaxID=129052 RepID=UPI00037C1D90|nr:acetate--CoA ligase [Catelliglobosispora koreensis]
MSWDPIGKTETQWASANLTDYEGARRKFTWEQAREYLSGLPGGQGLNIGYEAVDRHASGPRRDKVAIRFLGAGGAVTELTYAMLYQLTSRFANLLASLGVQPGERVFSLLGREPDLYVAALGTLRYQGVFSPLFAAFGPEPVRQRITAGDGVVLVTTPRLYEAKIAPIRHLLASLRHVLVTGQGKTPPGTSSLDDLMAAVADHFTVAPTDPQQMALLHFTSGTTGMPKGAVHVHEAVVAHNMTARLALDLHPDDIFWCTADPGWVTGMSYGIIAPLTLGVTIIADAGEFDARRWYQQLAEQRVTVWYTAPTALRMLMRHPPELAKEHDLSRLRFIASVGEPLNPEAVAWGQRTLGLAVHDNWWQTETGAIMISNFAGLEVRPGSMGRPLPGIDATILERGEDGRALIIDGQVRPVPSNVDGELALRPGFPSMFRGYLHEEQRYEKCFAGGWYLTGDLARCDEDGYFWFVGRADDVIKSAGHLIGPFEVESALMEHPAVAEAGVIGKPDPVAGEIVKAFVTLRTGNVPSDELRLDLLAFGRRRLGAVAPREIVFDQNLPHTRSGKVMRRLLKARDLGLPEGDLSTLESAHE